MNTLYRAESPEPVEAELDYREVEKLFLRGALIGGGVIRNRSKSQHFLDVAVSARFLHLYTGGKGNAVRSLCPALIGIALLLSGGSALGDTIKVSASVWGSAEDAGRDGTFDSIDPNNIVLQVNPVANIALRGLWEFDLSELPPLALITGINLELILVSSTLEGTPFDVFGHVGNGTIETADATAGSLLAAGLIAGGSTIFDVSSFILGPSVQAAGFAGFMARFPVETGTKQLFKQFQDPDADVFGNASPFLVVAFIPEPGTIWMFGSGLGLLGWMRRKAA